MLDASEQELWYKFPERSIYSNPDADVAELLDCTGGATEGAVGTEAMAVAMIGSAARTATSRGCIN